MRLERPPVRAEASIVAVDSCGDNIILTGTDHGEVATYGADKALTHTKNDAKVLSLLAVNAKSALVFSERTNGSIGSATAYSVPALEPLAGLTLRDVCGGVLLGRQVAVFSSGAIRILRFTMDVSPDEMHRASLERSIELKGVLKGCRCETDLSIMLVATSTEYQLVNVKTSAKIPLFPIHSSLEPLMAALGSDFLVVQGTGKLEPAMGLVVDSHGEVARSGVVIQWDSYPKSLAATGDYIFAVVESDDLVVHHVDPVTNAVREVTINVAKARKVLRLSNPVREVDNVLLEKLGNPNIARAKVDIALVLETGELELWGPPSRFVELETQIKSKAVNEVMPDPNTAGSEQGVAELEYLSQLLVFHSLDNGDYERATKAWLEGNQIPYETILFIYGDNVSEPKVYPGLRPLVLSLREKGKQGQLNESFLRTFLKTETKRHRRNPSMAYTTAKRLEMRYAQLLDDAELTRLLLERDLKARKEILQWLEESRRYAALEHYYTFSDRQAALAGMRLRLVRDTKCKQTDVQLAAQGLLEFALRYPGHEGDGLSIWDIAMELVLNPRIDSKLGIQILTHPKVQSYFEPGEVLKILKDRTDSGEVWRVYLKHLVYTRGIFTDDLATIVIADIIEVFTESGTAKDAVLRSYTSFREQEWPKPLYRTFLQRWAAAKKNKYPQELMTLQTELWHLLDQQSWAEESSGQLELPSIMSTFEARLSFLHNERALIFRGLGLHEKALSLLCAEITDYRAVIDYGDSSLTSDSVETKKDLARLAFKQVIELAAPDRDAVMHDLVTERGDCLDVDAVFAQISDSTPFSVIAEYSIKNVKSRQAAEQRAKFIHALTRADALRYGSADDQKS